MHCWSHAVSMEVMHFRALLQGTGSDACALTMLLTTRWQRPALAPGAHSRLQRARSKTKTKFSWQNGKTFNMLPWQMHRDTLYQHHICPYQYTCTALMLANCLLLWRRPSRRWSSLLCACQRSLHACAMPAREHHARMLCSSLRASSVCLGLLCFLVCINLSP